MHVTSNPFAVAMPDDDLSPYELLTRQERAVFDVLSAHQGRVFSRAELSSKAGISDLGQRRCDSLIVGIRRQVGADRIRTVRKRGWMLVV
jgi:DNA-binding response OmpR family regulator